MSSPKKLCLALLLFPVLSLGASPAREEYLEVMAAKPDEQHGRELFQNCVSCHGPVADGTTEGSTPRIAGQHFRVLVRQIINFRYGKRWDFRMEGVAADLHILTNAQDIADVATYVSQLDRGGTRGVGDGTMVERGAAIYASRCGSCHGLNGEGDNAGEIPRLAGQHAGYLMRQIYDAVDGRRPPLSRDHRKLLAHLDFDDVRGLSDFLARAGWNAAPPPHPYDTPVK
jgi:cytochrome c oxidase subunit 2